MLVRRQHSAAQSSTTGFTASQEEEIARIAETEGWEVAAHDYMRSLDHAAYRLAIEEHRLQLRFLLPVDTMSRVLDLQCGWGPVAFSLAACTACVVATDDRAARLRFVSARREQMDVESLHVVRGGSPSDSHRPDSYRPDSYRPDSYRPALPFADRTFDAVVLFEAPQAARREAGGRKQESILLQEIRRVLRASGYLLWGVFNRLGFARARVASSQHPRTYWGYLRSLRNTGFTQFQCYATLPSHHEPYFTLPLGRSRLANYLVDSLFATQEYRSKLEARGLAPAYELARLLWRVGRALRLSDLAPYVFPSYLILAH